MPPVARRPAASDPPAIVRLGWGLLCWLAVHAGEPSLAAGAPELAERLAALEARQDSLVSALSELEERALAGELAETELIALQEREGRRPSLGGYFDFEFFEESGADRPAYFRQHHLTILLIQELDDWRLFGEIEYENGLLIEGDGAPEAEVVRGAVKLENAWLEYVLHDALVLRGGVMFTPAHSVVHQWPNLWPTTRRALTFSVHPEKLVGLMAHGVLHARRISTGYRLYVSNGESANLARRDDNPEKAVGGQLLVQLGEWIGVRTADLAVNAQVDHVEGIGRDETWGVEARLEVRRFQVWSEAVDRVANSSRVRALYVQPRIALSGPLHALYRFDLRESAGTTTREHTLGAQLRAHDRVQLKLEVYRSETDGRDPYDGIATSVAVAF